MAVEGFLANHSISDSVSIILNTTLRKCRMKKVI